MESPLGICLRFEFIVSGSVVLVSPNSSWMAKGVFCTRVEDWVWWWVLEWIPRVASISPCSIATLSGFHQVPQQACQSKDFVLLLTYVALG